MSAAQIVSGNLTYSSNFQQTQTAGNVNSTGSTLNELINWSLQFVNATGVNKGVDQLFAKQFTLASTTATIHLETATQNDPFGNTLAMLRIRMLILQNINTTLNQPVEMYASASNGVTWLPASTAPLYAHSAGTATLPGYGGIIILDPDSFGASVGNVISATTDGITFNSVSSTVTFNFVALGCSVA